MKTLATSRRGAVMQFSISLSVALLLLRPFAQAREKKDPNPNLVNIHKLFIKGNNEAATEARKRLLVPRDQAVRVNCFGLVGNETVADSTLEISQDTAPDGAVTASGTITDRAGNLLWSDSKQGRTIECCQAIGIVLPTTSAASDATYYLISGLEDEICGVPPLIELSKVRKILVLAPGDFKNVTTWESGCLTFVKSPVDADAELQSSSRTGRKGKLKGVPILICVLFDPKNVDEIPGWQMDSDSFRGAADLEKAVGCR